MPVSKRDRVIHTSKVKRHNKDEKSEQIEAVRTAVQENQYVYVCEVSNDRNRALKEVRDELKPGKLFYSKNKLIQVAIGYTPETECAERIHTLSAYLKGHCGLICTNLSQDELLSVLKSHETEEYARTGDVATDTISLEAGFDALAEYTHSMEVQFRKLGLPTMLYDGKIKMLASHIVCNTGDILTADQAQLLKVLRVQMGKFQVKLVAVYDKSTEKVSEL
jgi:mRNA turnover protein 4